MSGFCPGWRYAPNVRTGPRACPVTALDVGRHGPRPPAPEGQPPLEMAWRGLDRIGEEELAAVRERARRALGELGLPPGGAGA
jgi:deoxyribodipyrimidine photolyase-related protein